MYCGFGILLDMRSLMPRLRVESCEDFNDKSEFLHYHSTLHVGDRE